MLQRPSYPLAGHSHWTSALMITCNTNIHKLSRSSSSVCDWGLLHCCAYQAHRSDSPTSSELYKSFVMAATCVKA